MKKNKLFVILLIGVITLANLSGCAEKTVSSSSNITLLNPANASVNSLKPSYRNLYQYQTYAGTIYPAITEYSFGKNVNFNKYCFFPGEQVQIGDILAKADDTQIATQIENLEDTMERLEESYNDDINEINKQLNKKLETKQDTMDWAAIALGEADRLNRDLSILEIEIDELRQRLENRELLYEIDDQYYSNKIANLKKDAGEENVLSLQDGLVVSINDYSIGDYISKGTNVVAIADTSQKILQCEYIMEKTIKNATRYYATINGEQYDVTYIPYEAEEYNSLIASGETVYSKFLIDDPEDQITFGSLGVIALIESEEESCLSIPASAIHKDEEGYYVYCIVDGENEKTYVTTGYTDKVYTQILEGVNEKDQILLTDYTSYGDNTQVLKTGDFVNDYTGSGYLTYPDYTMITNEIEYGTVTLTEICVGLYSVVEKGDVVAKVSVQRDEIETEENQLKMKRLKERKQDLLDQLNEPNNGLSQEERTRLTDQIAARQESIDELKEEMDKIDAVCSTTEIRAAASGIVIWESDKKSGAVVNKNEDLVLTASEDTCYLAISNSNQVLSYGNILQIEYTDESDVKNTAEGVVVTVSQNALSSGAGSNYACIKVPLDVLLKMNPTTASAYGNYLMWISYNVSGTPRNMDHVLLVPKRAVTSTNGQLYVNVVDENGEIRAISFISGGYDVENYWVLEGLEEGMTICLE